jgi:hypothetical protein
MAVYKVPQDVEADDKLIGPFSFRQFIYLIIALISVALAWGLAQLFIGLAIVPLPLVVFFGALALPLRKDQPMEIYLAAVVSFYLKPRRRLWQPDGIQSLVEITAPKVIEIQRTKNLSEGEAQRRLSYLADIVDTGGWSVRGVSVPQAASSMQTDAFFAAQQTEDVLSSDGGVSRTLDSMISQADAKRHEEMLERMHQPPSSAAVIAAIPNPYATLNPTVSDTQAQAPISEPHLTFNPYPSSIHQAVIAPLDPNAPAPVATPQTIPRPTQVAVPPRTAPAPTTPQVTAPITSEKVVSPDIINLANNTDLSIETIAHEANRIHQKEGHLSEDEVMISLR